ncbi:MAG: beta-galactosidase [Frankiales bacterium]|nr:beta-galactosidase [Frankiales bacterium]
MSPDPGASRRVGFDARGLLLDGVHVPWLSAECHTWRLDPDDWPRIVDTLVELGFTAVSAYVPWSRYEQADGSFDFATGSLDIARFARLAQQRGLVMTARIGPNAGAELEDSGWPRRVLDDPRCQALRPDGRPYLLPTSVHHATMPSFGSRQTLHEIGRWYDAVAEVLAPLQWPDGPIVAVHVDNEMGYHFQHHAFAMDYHPDTLAQWNAAHPGVPAPRGWHGEDEDARVEWVRFSEVHLRESLRTLARMQRETGFDRVLQVHNDYPRLTTPIGTGALERSGAVDIAAGDVYATRMGGRYVRDYARHLDASTTMAYLAEAGVGWLTLPWLLPMEVVPADFEHTLWRALSGGVRAINVFMAVARDRWYGAPVDATGRRNEPLATIVQRALALMKELDWSSLRREPKVLLLENRDDQRRFASRAVRGDLVPPFRQVLPIDPRLFEGHDPHRQAADAWDRSARAALDTEGVDVDHASTDCLPLDLSRYETILLPNIGGVSPEVRQALQDSGALVVAGPVGLGFGVAADDVSQLIPVPRWRREDPALDLCALSSERREVLVAHNASGDAIEAKVDTGGAMLIGRWREETVSDGIVRLEPYGVQVYEVVRP